ncbi:hypothetical protein ES705_38903 [subsurface metagenome]
MSQPFTSQNNSTNVLACQVSTDVLNSTDVLASTNVLNRAERTPGAAAVSGWAVSSGGPGGSLAAYPETNSRLPFIEGGFFIGQPSTSPRVPPRGVSCT